MELDRTSYVLKHLVLWQEKAHNHVDNESDIAVFNSIGTLITLVSGGLMHLSKTHQFLTDTLSLSVEEQEKAYQVFIECYNKGLEEKKENEKVY